MTAISLFYAALLSTLLLVLSVNKTEQTGVVVGYIGKHTTIKDNNKIHAVYGLEILLPAKIKTETYLNHAFINRHYGFKTYSDEGIQFELNKFNNGFMDSAPELGSLYTIQAPMLYKYANQFRVFFIIIVVLWLLTLGIYYFKVSRNKILESKHHQRFLTIQRGKHRKSNNPHSVKLNIKHTS